MKSDRFKEILMLIASILPFLGCAQVEAAPLNDARMTYVASDVRVDSVQGMHSRISTGGIVSAGATINNGAKARSELTFANRSVARLGANTVLELGNEPAAMRLREGAILFQIPKHSKAQITTGSIVVASKGATGLLERNQDLYVKLLLLEGEVRVALSARIGESILLKAGQILITNTKATALPEAAYFDIARAVRTCQLITEFPPLGNQDAIAREAVEQLRLTSHGAYIPSNLVIFGRGTLVSLVPPRPSDNAPQKPTPNPQPAN
jgi:hypothetical protein